MVIIFLGFFLSEKAREIIFPYRIAISIIFLLLGIYFLISKIKAGNRFIDIFKTYCRSKFGISFSEYLFYEISLLIGAISFICRPFSNWKKIKNSYFVTSYDVGVFFFLIFILIAEPLLVHLLVDKVAEGTTKMVLHVALILMEIYAVELVLGNIYYLKLSKVIVARNSLYIKLGLIFQIRIPYSKISSFQKVSLNSPEKGGKKIGLLASPNYILNFTEKISLKFFYKIIKVEKISIQLKNVEIQKINSRINQV